MLMNLLNGQGALQGNMPSPATRQAQSSADAPNGYQQTQQQGPPTPYQQTRSGRISRPPAQPAPFFPDWSLLTAGMQGSQNPADPGVANQGVGQANNHGTLPFPSQSVLRAIQVLQQPGMEVVRQALASTEWMNQMSGNSQGQGQGQRQPRPEYPGPVVSYRPDEQQDADEPYATNAMGVPEPEHSAGQKRRRVESDRTAGLGSNQGGQRVGGDDVRVDNTSAGHRHPDHEISDSDGDEYGDGGEGGREEGSSSSARPPDWPAPIRGKGSRLAMSKEEIVARRKHRNRLSATAHREKKNKQVAELQARMDEMQAKVEEREGEVRAALQRCAQLEQQ